MDIGEGSTVDAMIEGMGMLVHDSRSSKELDIDIERYFEELQNDETKIEWDFDKDSDKDVDNDPDEDSDGDADDDPTDDSIDKTMRILTHRILYPVLWYDALRMEETGPPTTSQSSALVAPEMNLPTLDMGPCAPDMLPLAGGLHPEILENYNPFREPPATSHLSSRSGSMGLTKLGLSSLRLSEIYDGESFKERTRGRRGLMRAIGPRYGIIRITQRIKPSTSGIRRTGLRERENGEPRSTWAEKFHEIRKKAEKDVEASSTAMPDDLQLMAIITSGMGHNRLYEASLEATHFITESNRAVAALAPCCLDHEQRLMRRVEDVVSIVSAVFYEHMTQLLEHNDLAYIPFPLMMPLVRAAMSVDPSTFSSTTAAAARTSEHIKANAFLMVRGSKKKRAQPETSTPPAVAFIPLGTFAYPAATSTPLATLTPFP
ncbi:hypothetical protein M9H77_07034 [Catharanthus roseus]|uniref:Uncharacterized protein n=1 Tax=Catharanthus roseus TaxID=4058 RepID=A0ACC0BTS9_CATRO|nr:hypothetical protein M9H77_07034 [Catharanthus roseus]